LPFTLDFSSSDTPSSDHDSSPILQLPSKSPDPPDPPAAARRMSASPPPRLFDRYLTHHAGFPSRSRLFYVEQTVHYMLHRRHSRQKGLKRKLFQLTDAKTSDVLAGAKFASLTSSVLKVCNSKGLVCEVDVKGSSGPFVMRIGNDPTLVLRRGAGGSVTAEFAEFDGTVPPYAELVSPPMSAEAMITAFGTRRALKSVKNCRLCQGSEEIVAVRKVHPNSVEIDSRRNLSFVSCFVIGLFMFLTKP
jgi:hypothetical protein